MTTPTDIAVREQPTNAVALAPITTGAVATLTTWVAEVSAAYELAKQLCVTSFVPQHFRGKPAEAAAAILTGHELGLSPLASLRSIFMIGGTPGMYAKVLVAIVMSHGHDVWVEEQSDERVVVCGQRKGSEHTARVVWDRERVVKAKLLSNGKYNETPQQMMVARGSAEVCRQIAPDALLGIPYSVEELRDMPQDEQAPAEPAVARVTADEILAGETDEAAAGDETHEGVVVDV
jgi:hypothetical protein